MLSAILLFKDTEYNLHRGLEAKLQVCKKHCTDVVDPCDPPSDQETCEEITKYSTALRVIVSGIYRA